MANKFKVGDIVRVKTFEELKKDFNIDHSIDYYDTNGVTSVCADDGLSFTNRMLMYCGKITRIKNIDTYCHNRYSLENIPTYLFTEGMLERLPSIDEVEAATIEQDVDSITVKIPDMNTKEITEGFKVWKEEIEMEDIKLLNVYEEKGLSRLKELKGKEYESIINSTPFIAKFRAITDVYNNACKELFESQHREEPDLDIYPIRKNNYEDGCDYVIDDEYLDKIDEELIEKYEKLRKEFTDNISECRMQIKLVQQTSNSYEDITKILKLYGIIDNNGKVVTYEPVNKKDNIKDEPVKETFKPKRKYNKKQKVNENNN